MEKYVVKTAALTKRYHDQTVVKDVSIAIPKGKIYGLLGRNGAGKTTIMKILLGLAGASSGEVLLFGQSPNTHPEVYLRIGNIIETPSFYPYLTGQENLKVFSKLKGQTQRNSVAEALKLVDLTHAEHKRFANYSLGMKQRLGIANALMKDPELLILDEPTNGLDPIGIVEIRRLLKELAEVHGKTILISSHQLSEIEQIADIIGILHDGELLEECDLEKIAQHNQRYISVTVSDIHQAARLLEEQLNLSNYTVDGNDTIKIFDFSFEPQEINRLFGKNGIEVSSLFVGSVNLEEHFRKITGGVGIA
ncbi:ABC transporter ATP-binding protein [Candidatus Enterococcus murrayae]|uniref:ABC transporter ATP-binding protein n=1 Tax=Candidatus Enterococcus murrayae TaxID=2815321 RepID=A0ABS3HDP3_9ENTE|nr:ABC transporter ATP-binding protein [Enterococcus sp. MJM16]MBO0451588.1 ABC transporter ATP-binding protein [Enterococcus sp. MJM16]